MAAWACHVIPVTRRLNRGPRIVPRWSPGADLVARGPWPADLVAVARVCVCVTWCLMFVYSVHKHGPASCALHLVPGLADLVAVDLVAVDLVPGPVARATWCAPWWPPTWCRGPRRLVLAPWCLVADPGAGGPKKRAGSLAARALALFHTVSGA